MTASLRLCCVGFGLAVVLGCKRESPPTPGPAPATGAVGRSVWLRNAVIFDAARQHQLARIDAATRVELFAGGRVRSAPGSVPVVDGYLQATLLQAPVDGQGVALYAQRAAELHHGAPDGPVIGSIAVGAFVSVAALPAGAGSSTGATLIALPGFGAQGPTTDESALAFVSLDALGAQPQPLQRASNTGVPPAARSIRDFPAGIPLAASVVSDDSFAATLCGDVQVLEQQPPRARIAQAHAGVEVRGWVDADVQLHRGPVRCTLRVVYRQDQRLISVDGTTAADRADVAVIPAGYVDRPTTYAEHVLEMLRRGTPLHWLVHSASGLSCQAWTPTAVRPGADGSVTGRWLGLPRTIEGKPSTPSFALTYRAATSKAPGELTLLGPHWAASGGSDTSSGYRAASVYTIVGTTPDALRIFPDALSDRAVAWHPDDEERWFVSDSSCQSAARALAAAPPTDERHPRGGVHINPFPELD